MKKVILSSILILVLTVSFVSCRDAVADTVKEVGSDVMDAAKDNKDKVKN